MKIGIDIMGGDFAPEATVSGAFLALDKMTPEDSIVFIGDESLCLAEIQKLGRTTDRI